MELDKMVSTSRRSFFKGAGAAAIAPTLTNLPSKTAAKDAAGSRLVHTVTGPIEASRLGVTLPHEHLFSSSAGMWRVWPELFGGRKNFIKRAVTKLKEARNEGIDTIVDLTTADLGRDIRLSQEISYLSGVQIIACTGHWSYPALSMESRSVDELQEFFLREIEHGIENTDIKAGVIKVATDKEGVTPFIENVLRAAARTSKATGVPIETHSYALPPNPTGTLQADIFDSEGVNPSKVSIGHSDNSVNMDYLMVLAARGYTLGMDHMSRGVLPAGQTAPPEIAPYLWGAKTRRIKSLIDAGYKKQLLISNDWIFADTAFATGTLDAMELSNPDGILFVKRRVIPYLKELGVTDDIIDTITVDNPFRFWTVIP